MTRMSNDEDHEIMTKIIMVKIMKLWPRWSLWRSWNYDQDYHGEDHEIVTRMSHDEDHEIMTKIIMVKIMKLWPRWSWWRWWNIDQDYHDEGHEIMTKTGHLIADANIMIGIIVFLLQVRCSDHQCCQNPSFVLNWWKCLPLAINFSMSCHE